MGDIENAADDLKGKAKEAYGEVADDQSKENEGKADQVISDAKDKASDAADAVKDKANEVIGKFKDN
ncbi:CsbD family protein [Corynebacterium massiliense]|uniref:CsbD-like protein n=1 Tax=Corynebacterium massiliense DSM 45435 TaxID=1121364 RepID=A0ABY7U6K8_9CORY|nr:CsbD family protein [Corynebacterium massiliense]WCZ31604.1 CsbD-like protein [Corynebacterium massiliense DSM 45435]